MQSSSQKSGLMPGNGWICGCDREVFHVPLSVFSSGKQVPLRGAQEFLNIPFSETLLKIFLDCAYTSSSYLGVNLSKTAVPGKKYSQSWLKCFQSVPSSSWQQEQHSCQECLEGADGNSCAYQDFSGCKANRKLSIPFPSQQKAKPGVWKLGMPKAGLLPTLWCSPVKGAEAACPEPSVCPSLLRRVSCLSDDAKAGLCSLFAQPAEPKGDPCRWGAAGLCSAQVLCSSRQMSSQVLLSWCLGEPGSAPTFCHQGWCSESISPVTEPAQQCVKAAAPPNTRREDSSTPVSLHLWIAQVSSLKGRRELWLVFILRENDPCYLTWSISTIRFLFLSVKWCHLGALLKYIACTRNGQMFVSLS